MNLLERLAMAPVYALRRFADSLLWPAWLRSKGVRHGAGLTLVGKPHLRLADRGEIVLGNGVKLISRPDSNPLWLRSPCSLMLLHPGARISIGDGSALGGSIVCAAESVEIGRRALFGANCVVTDTDFHPLPAEMRREHPTRGAAVRPVRIGDDVFVGANAILLKGVTIGDGCVVGAGAVVTGTFPAGSIIAGSPARVVSTVPGRMASGCKEGAPS